MGWYREQPPKPGITKRREEKQTNYRISLSCLYVSRSLCLYVSMSISMSLGLYVSMPLPLSLSLSLSAGPSRRILSLPLRHAGLGILDLQHEAALRFVQGALALSDHGRLNLSNMDSWTADVAVSIGYLETTARINVEDPVAGKPTHKQGRIVRLAFYDTPLGEPAMRRLQTQAGLAWFTASPQTFLPHGPFRLAFTTHLRLPVFNQGQRYQYRPLSSGLPCNQQLGPYCCNAHVCLWATHASPRSPPQCLG